MGKLSKIVEDMFYAAVIGNLEILQRCLKDGANINEADDDGSTPLMLAAVNGQTEAVKFLLKNGADSAKKDVDGWDAAKLARNAGFEPIAVLIENSSKGQTTSQYPEGLQEIAIVAFVNEKAREVREKLKEIKETNGADERTITETNHLNILVFAEANAFYKHLDKEVRGTITGNLEYLNEDFAKASKELGRPTDKVDITAIKDYNVSRLLNEDEQLLREVTKEIYDSVVSFVSEELEIRPSEFAVKYGAYHKRLMKMRDALLDSLRSVGSEGARRSEHRITVVNIIGKKPE
jgi:hypothetical protein